MNTEQLIEITEKYGAHNYHPLPIVISRAEGIWVYDPEGKKYMDMLSSYSAINHGHCHPKIVEAMVSQAQKVTLTSRAFHNDQLGPFSEELAQLCEMEKVLPMNTGAEAVETAIKAARKWGYQKKGVQKDMAEIIVCTNNFHGRTITIVTFSTEESYREGFGPFTPGFKVIPYGDSQALEDAISTNTVAFLVEPIQGEGGVIVPPSGYLSRVREICDREKVLLMADEIQSGFCRTGKMFCFQHENIQPDVLILGKALGGGILPISAVVSSDEVMSVFRPGDHGSTFGGNPLACAVARTSIKIMLEEDMARQASEKGGYFMDKLVQIDSPHTKEVRGKGLLIGLELKPEAGGARLYCEQLMAKGLLCKETHENVIRFAPPLVITREEMDLALEKIADVLK